MKKKQLVAILSFLVVIVFVFLIWFFNSPEPHPGLKEITLDVFHGDGTSASLISRQALIISEELCNR